MSGLRTVIQRETEGTVAAGPDQTRRVTLIVPVYNEEHSIAPFLDQLTGVLGAIKPLALLDILFVNDGSRDATERLILAAAAERADISLINLSRNFGKEAALFAGLNHASGDAVIPLDVDLQDPPEVITEMIRRWIAGAKVVNARRARRDGDSRFKAMSARAFYRVFNSMADQPIPQNVGDFRLLDRAVVDAICQLGERSRFNKSLFHGSASRRKKSPSTAPPVPLGKPAGHTGSFGNWRWTEFLRPRPCRCESGPMSAYWWP